MHSISLTIQTFNSYDGHCIDIFSDTLMYAKNDCAMRFVLPVVIFDVSCLVQNTILTCYGSINFIAVSLPCRGRI